MSPKEKKSFLRCGDGYGESSPYLCGQNLSPWQVDYRQRYNNHHVTMPCQAIIIFCHQQSRSKHTPSVSLIPQAALHRATPTFSATQHILIFRMQTFRLALLTFDLKVARCFQEFFCAKFLNKTDLSTVL